MTTDERPGVPIALDREAVIYVDHRRKEAHFIDGEMWSPERLDYVQRSSLAARLRALAEVIDPGTYDEHLERTRVRLGAESVGRA